MGVDPNVHYLYTILAFLMAAVGVVFLFRRMKASPVLGYLAAGMLVGPHMLQIIKDPTDTQFLGEIGVVFLLFTLGLELPLQRLNSLKKYVFGLGVPQVLATAALFAAIGMVAGFSKEACILIGGALSLSSTAVVLQVLSDRREMASRFGRISFSILLFQDIAVVFLLILATTFSGKEESLMVALSFAIMKALFVLLAIGGLGRLVFRPLYRAVAQSGSSELFMATTFLVILGTAFLTEFAGLSRELGAFLAGILLAETEYRHQIEADIQPFRGLLLGVFFMSVGMGINLGVFLNSVLLVLGLLVFVLALKTAVIFSLCRFNTLKVSLALRTSLLLAGGGEFVFVIFSPGVARDFLPQGYEDILFLVVILSMGLTPLLAIIGKWISDKFLMREAQADPSIQEEEIREFQNHVIVAGFGRVGQMLADLLASRMIPFVAIDTDMRRVTEGREKGYPVFFGDAKQLKVMQSIGAARAKVVVITLNQANSSVGVVMMLRRRFPDLPICVRVKDHKHHEKLMKSGARLVVPETVEPTAQLATSLLHVLGMAPEEISQLVDSFRKQKWMVSIEKKAEE